MVAFGIALPYAVRIVLGATSKNLVHRFTSGNSVVSIARRMASLSVGWRIFSIFTKNLAGAMPCGIFREGLELSSTVARMPNWNGSVVITLTAPCLIYF